jgi:TolB-like protein/DNA-binding winged helix-turn-helix (wHTH) protein
MCGPRCRSTLTIGTRESPQDHLKQVQGCVKNFRNCLCATRKGNRSGLSGLGWRLLNKYPHEDWRIGDWRVSPDRGEISHEGETKKLDPRAMRLLMFLAERAGEIVGVTELLDGVWGKAVVTPHSVYEAVAALRQALGDSPDKPEYIVTLPRRGYRLIAPVVSPRPPSGQSIREDFSAVDTASKDEVATAPRPRRMARVWFAVAVALATISTVAWLTRTALAPPRRASVETSIAVLPFVDLSEKKDQEYLADGLAEELLDVLANLPGLRVIGRTSSFQFKNKNDDVRSIGAQLGVAFVVEGSVRRAASHVRVAAQLIRTSDGAHQWSGTFDRNINDTLQLESELAASLGRALELSVASDGPSNRVETSSAEANDRYLQGLHALDTYTRAGTEEAANQFQAAIALDPQFAAAYVSLARTYYVQAEFGFVPPNVGFPRVRQEALRALEADPRSAIAHALLARVATLYTWDWAEARQQSDAALALGSRNAFALYAAANLATILGDFDRSEKLLRGSLASDPLSPETHCMLSLVSLAGDRFEAAEVEARKCLSISPTYAYGHFLLAYNLLFQGRADQEVLDQCSLETPEGGRMNCLAIIYFKLGRLKDAEVALGESIRTRGNFAAFGIARVYAYMSQSDRAFEWLEKAFQVRDPVLAYIKAERIFAKLRGDYRYKALLQKMNLPE